MSARKTTPPEAIRAWVRGANRWARQHDLAIEKGVSVPPAGLPAATAERLWAAVRLQRDLARKLASERAHLQKAEARLAEVRARIMQDGATYALRQKGRAAKGTIERHTQRVAELTDALASCRVELRRDTVACYARARHLETGRIRPETLALEHPELAEGYLATREAKRTAAEDRRLAQRQAEARTAKVLAPMTRAQRSAYLATLGEQAKLLLADGVSWEDVRLQLGLGGDWLRVVRHRVNKPEPEDEPPPKPIFKGCATCVHGQPEPSSVTGFTCLAEAYRACKPWFAFLRWEAKP